MNGSNFMVQYEKQLFHLVIQKIVKKLQEAKTFSSDPSSLINM